MFAVTADLSRRSVRRGASVVREWWRAAATRLTLSFALSGTVAMVVPFIVLLVLGRPQGAVLAALGGMNTILASVGSAYRSRVFSMSISLALGTISVFIGCLIPLTAWFSPLVFAAIMFSVGMTRIFGPVGKSVAVTVGVMFLVGSFSPLDASLAAEVAGYCLVGGLWAMLALLAMWWARPYRYLFMQLAVCYESCSELVEALATELAGGNPKGVRRRLRRDHRQVREAIRTAEETLESVRVGAGHSNPIFDRVLILLAAASREATAAVSLRTVDWHSAGPSATQAWQRLFSGWSAVLSAIALSLSSGRGAIDVAPMRAAFEVLEAQHAITTEARAPLRLALLHLDAIAEAGARMSKVRFFWRETLPRFGPGGLRNVWATLAAQFTLRSIIFRHALRVALVAGFGLWVSGVFDLTHRLWLPLTAIVVLQPEFGATWQRLWQRVGGTLIGVLIAGALSFYVHGLVGEIAVITICAYGMFFFIRTHYGLGVVMLTPMVLLLLGVLAPQTSGGLIVGRGIDTLLGGALALAAAFLLWPMWQRSAFIPQCAEAVRAYRGYLALVFALPGDGKLSHPELMQARHRAERESDNADAILHRMLSEPRRTRGNVRAALGFVVWLRRLADNGVHFAVELDGGKLAEDERNPGEELLHRLDTVSDALEHGDAGEKLATIRPRLTAEAPTGRPLTFLFERLAVDTAALAAAARKL